MLEPSLAHLVPQPTQPRTTQTTRARARGGGIIIDDIPLMTFLVEVDTSRTIIPSPSSRKDFSTRVIDMHAAATTMTTPEQL